MQKKYWWTDDYGECFEVFSETPPTPNAEEIDDNSSIDFSYYPDAYDEEGIEREENERLVDELKLPKNKEVRVDFTIDGSPYHLTVMNLDNGFYKGVVISNNRQDIDPGDLSWLKGKYVKMICNKIKEGN